MLKEALGTYSDALQDAQKSVEDLTEAQLKMVDEISDSIDKQIDRYEALGDEIEHYTKIIEMTEGDKAYDNLIRAQEISLQNSQAQVDLLHTTLQNLQQGLANLEETGGKYTEE